MSTLQRKLFAGGLLGALCCAFVGNLLAEPSDGGGAPAAAPVSISAAERVVPHPMTPARQRIAAQRRLFVRLDQALASRDFIEVRRLLALHDTQFSESEAWSDWRQGYERIADCQEHPGAASRAAGQRFVDEERGSRLRRRVRRACLK